MEKKTLPHSNTSKDKKIDDRDFISVNLSLSLKINTLFSEKVRDYREPFMNI